LKNTLPIGKENLIALVVLVLVSSVAASLIFRTEASCFPEYDACVHTSINSGVLGNWTHMEKPLFPVCLNNSQVQIGRNWSVVCPLRANHSYHAYCYGEWINRDLEPQTDYDVYVYDPFGEIEGYHTESAGLPEHLGTTSDEPYFVPKYSGEYTFVIRNDPRESKGSQQATFTIIETVECNAWHEHFIKGKEGNIPVSETSWAYEFVTESEHIEVLIKVPRTLDMYEARLYLMANPEEGVGSILNDVPLAWEPGLYGERDGVFGGYNLESREYRGLAYASCEFHGQDMLINFTSQCLGKGLYHLALIGEEGSGTIEFIIKTEFEDVCLKSSAFPKRVYPNNNTVVAYVSNSTDLKDATLQYSIDSWKNVTTLEMEIVNNRTCRRVIPGQAAGILVSYKVEACDVLENYFVAYGNYSVKDPSQLNVASSHETVHLGDNITVKGHLTPQRENLSITVYFTSANETREVICYTIENGTFTASFKPENLGVWKAIAEFSGDESTYESVSSQLTIKVEEQPLLMKYSLYIGGVVCAIVVIGVVVYVRKSRE
jgi:hypothetical protein